MFLTTFDKKMYAEALREEGREEMAQKYAELSQKHANLVKNHARRLFENGAPFELVKKSVTELSEEELMEIYQNMHEK